MNRPLRSQRTPHNRLKSIRPHTKPRSKTTADPEDDVMGDAWPCDVPNRLAEPFTPEDGRGPITTEVSLEYTPVHLSITLAVADHLRLTMLACHASVYPSLCLTRWRH